MGMGGAGTSVAIDILVKYRAEVPELIERLPQIV